MTQDNAIALLRKKAGVTQKKAGEVLGGRSRDTIRRWERNPSEYFPSGSVPVLARLYNCSELEVLTAINGNPTSAPEATTESA